MLVRLLVLALPLIVYATSSLQPATASASLSTLPDELLLEIAKKLTSIRDVYALNASLTSPLIRDYASKANQVDVDCGMLTVQLLFDDVRFILNPQLKLHVSLKCLQSLHTFLSISTAFTFNRINLVFFFNGFTNDTLGALHSLKLLSFMPSIRNVDIDIFYLLNAADTALIPADAFAFNIARLIDPIASLPAHIDNTGLLEVYQSNVCDMVQLIHATAALQCHEIFNDNRQRVYTNTFILDLTEIDSYNTATLKKIQKIELIIDMSSSALASNMAKVVSKVTSLRVENIDDRLIAIPELGRQSSVILELVGGPMHCGIIEAAYFNADRVSIRINPHTSAERVPLMLRNIIMSVLVAMKTVSTRNIDIRVDLTMLTSKIIRVIAVILNDARSLSAVSVNHVSVGQAIEALSDGYSHSS